MKASAHLCSSATRFRRTGGTGQGLSRHAFALALLASAAACGGETSVVIGRVDIEAETVPLPCDNPVWGPNREAPMLWCTVADENATAEWLSPPTPEEARVRVSSERDASAFAGMAFSFDEHGTVRDLSIYDHLTFTGYFPAGFPFDVIVGRSRDHGCSFPRPTGGAQGTYSIDLTNPAWCMPSLCGWDLKAAGAYFLTRASVDFAVQDVGATTNKPGAVGSVSAMQADIGPGGYCWFPFAWYSGSEAALEPPTTPDLIHVVAKSGEQQTAGLAFELPEGFDASRYSALEIEGTILPEGPFFVQFVRELRGMTWTLQATGAGTYTVNLQEPAVTFGGAPTMTLAEANRVEIATVFAEAAALDAAITGVRFVP